MSIELCRTMIKKTIRKKKKVSNLKVLRSFEKPFDYMLNLNKIVKKLTLPFLVVSVMINTDSVSIHFKKPCALVNNYVYTHLLIYMLCSG